MSDSKFIPFNLPEIGSEEINAVVEVLKSGWLTTGSRTELFEREFAKYVSTPHALAVNSCTAGLHLALAGLGIGPGDEVITTPLTFCATINTIIHVGANPVLADVNDDGNINPDSIRQRITGRTRALLPVHLAGLPCNMSAIWTLARAHGLKVIEDAAHAVGSIYDGRQIGAKDPANLAQSDAVAFSFYATKNLTTGEGGMVTTPHEKLMERMRMLCLHGISKDAWNRYSEKGRWFYEVLESGFKYNLSDIQSAIGIHQLRKLERFIEIRDRYAAMYNNAFANMPEVELPPDNTDGRHSWHLYMLRLNLDRLTINRDEFIEQLHKQKIGASVHFIPIPLHPFFAARASLKHNECPNALKLYPRLVSIPLYPSMTEEDVKRVISTVKEIFHSARKETTLSICEPA